MHIVFINYNKFEGNSGIHIHPLANELVQMGHEVTVYLPSEQSTKCSLNDKALYTSRSFNDERMLHNQKGIIFISWTPREIVRKKTINLCTEYKAPYFVHLEDNEEQIIEDSLNIPIEHLSLMEGPILDQMIPENISHPIYYKDFINGSNGVTCIINTLEEFVPKHIPAISFWPACENEIYEITLDRNQQIRKDIGIEQDEYVIFYPGNIHTSNIRDVMELYTAISILNKENRKVKLIRTGQNYVNVDQYIDLNRPYYMEMGECPLSANIKYIAAADIVIQPGKDNNFNHFRFPSKIPMFLASGRPLILGNTNFGEYLTDWKNCVKFVNGDSEELVQKILLLLNAPKLAFEIGKKGRQFALENFCWHKSARIFENFILSNILTTHKI
jgi:glycosyltransferase involved in cell wall biosynthesis